MKETYYFSHDYNSTQDPKMMAILSTCGLAGIGMYWILIELLHQQPESRMLYKSYEDYIEFYGRVDGENEHLLNNIKQMLINTGLLLKEDEYIFSNRVLQNKKERERLSDLRSLAGKKSAEVRANSTSVQRVFNKAQQGKERKGKEINSVPIGTQTIKLMEEEYTLEELSYETIGSAKSKYGSKTMAVLARKFAEVAGIEIGTTFDASEWAKPLSAIYKRFNKDPDKTMKFFEDAGKWYTDKGLTFTPHTLEKNFTMLTQKWLKDNSNDPRFN